MVYFNQTKQVRLGSNYPYLQVWVLHLNFSHEKKKKTNSQRVQTFIEPTESGSPTSEISRFHKCQVPPLLPCQKSDLQFESSAGRERKGTTVGFLEDFMPWMGWTFSYLAMAKLYQFCHGSCWIFDETSGILESSDGPWTFIAIPVVPSSNKKSPIYQSVNPRV